MASEIRDVSSLPLSKPEIQALYTSGFHTVADIASMQPIDLAQETGLSLQVSARIILAATKGKEIATETYVSANELTIRNRSERPIITFCRAMDRMLGGGISIGQITELCGVPGVGKTQLAIQLACDVHIPECFGGSGGEAVYIDTEGSFMASRAAQIATAISQHLERVSKNPKGYASDLDTLRVAASTVTYESILSGIHVFRIHDQTELLALLQQLPAFISSSGRIKLVVIDSIAFHFRQDLQDVSNRNRLLSALVQQLNKCAYENKLAVVLTNHVTTRLEYDPVTNRSTGHLVPALGEFWSHCITNRVMMEWSDSPAVRRATLVKSTSRPVSGCEFIIRNEGIREPERGDTGLKRARDEDRQED